MTETLLIRRVDAHHYKVNIDGRWVSIRRGEMGFSMIDHDYPAIKGACGAAAEREDAVGVAEECF